VWDLGGVKDKVKSLVRPKSGIEHFINY